MTGITLKSLCELLEVKATGEDRRFQRLSGFEDAAPDSIVFAEDEGALQAALASAAGLILAPDSLVPGSNGRILGVRQPKYAFALLGRWMNGSPGGVIHPTAWIGERAEIGPGTSVGAYSVVEDGAAVGKCCRIGNHVTIHPGVMLGDDVVVQAGAVLGSTGFGYVRGPDRSYILFPQQGRLVIGDGVEIGANTTIDRGALGETRIGRGTKIDNLVHIGHNCTIGEDVIIAAQVGIAGSTKVGDGAILAGQVGLAEHVEIGPGVIVGAQGGVPTSKRLTGSGEVFWGTPARPIREYLKDLAKLRRSS
jgi:UDP-3-O-[3-hydroxymyristoyl] glucosamine N-acyltransferase